METLASSIDMGGDELEVGCSNPEERVALAKATLVIEGLDVHREADKVEAAIKAWAKASSTLLVLIDCGGGCSAVVSKYLTNLKAIMPSVVTLRIAIVCAHTLAMLAACEVCVHQIFPNLGVVHCRLSTGRTTAEPASGRRVQKKKSYSVNEWLLIAKAVDGSLPTEEFDVPFSLTDFPYQVRKLDRSFHACPGGTCAFFENKSGEEVVPNAELHKPTAADVEEQTLLGMMESLMKDAGSELFNEPSN